jgi:hypothetical protein
VTHTHCTRVNTNDGSRSLVEFGEIDGRDFAQKFEWKNNKGFHTQTALLIVNRWNYISQLQRTFPDFLYYLHTADGAE